LCTLMPALLTTMSTRPKRSSAAATTPSHACRTDTSAGLAIDSGESTRQASTTASRRSLRRATATTFAPRRARPVATAAPMPEEAPVTTATLPRMSAANCAEPVDAGRRALLGAPGPEVDAVADHGHAAVTGRRQRDHVQQHTG